MRTFRSFRDVALLLGALALAACGSSPSGPSALPTGGVTLSGTVLGLASGASAGVSALSASGVTVTVQEDPNITTQVGSDGTFTLRGLPEFGFTLVFTGAGGEPLGTLPFTAVLPNQEITITVDVSSGSVRLLEEQRNGIGHGDLEIEGDIDSVVSVDPAGDSLFMIAGYEVVARPGQTAIRQGGRALSVEDLEAGDQVHVKGVWLALPAGADPADQQVLAWEIKLQQEDDSDSTGAKVTICHKKKNTLSISVSAWPAHQAHGDTMGACPAS